MADASFLAWPFFAAEHRALGPALDAWAAQHVSDEEYPDVDAGCRTLVADLGRDGWLRYAVPAAHGGAFEAVDSRAVCLVRETLARRNALADFAFAMQGLGSAPIVLGGSAELQRRYLPRVADGSAIAAFARAERDGKRVQEIPIHIVEKRPPSINLFKRVPKVLRDITRLTYIIRVKG